MTVSVILSNKPYKESNAAVILSNKSYKESNARFTTVLLKARYDLDINVYDFENRLFLIVGSLQKCNF